MVPEGPEFEVSLGFHKEVKNLVALSPAARPSQECAAVTRRKNSFRIENAITLSDGWNKNIDRPDILQLGKGARPLFANRARRCGNRDIIPNLKINDTRVGALRPAMSVCTSP